MSERTVGKTFDAIFAEHQNQRIIVATFASNVDRVQQVVNTAYKYRPQSGGGRPQHGDYHGYCQQSWGISMCRREP